MAAGMYLEHYLDSIENLPFELHRNFQLVRHLDQRAEGRKGLSHSIPGSRPRSKAHSQPTEPPRHSRSVFLFVCILQ
uniref:Inhibitor of growth protein N-terminal histone-binding domain-containing protein n=3 Tax=Canis lupus TaxID=9612 RepID=A0A8I3Q5K6_CANLF